jgi:hypothetical protein
MTSFYKFWEATPTPTGNPDPAAPPTGQAAPRPRRKSEFDQTGGNPATAFQAYMNGQATAWAKLQTVINKQIEVAVKTLSSVGDYDYVGGRAALPAGIGADPNAIGYDPLRSSKRANIPGVDVDAVGYQAGPQGKSGMSLQRQARLAQMAKLKADLESAKGGQQESIVQRVRRLDRLLAEAGEIKEPNRKIGAEQKMLKTVLDNLRVKLTDALREYERGMADLNAGMQTKLSGYGSDYNKSQQAGEYVGELEEEVDRLTKLLRDQTERAENLNSKVTSLEGQVAELLTGMTEMIRKSEAGGKDVSALTERLAVMKKLAEEKTEEAKLKAKEVADTLQQLNAQSQKITRLARVGKLSEDLIQQYQADVEDIEQKNNELTHLAVELKEFGDKLRDQIVKKGYYKKAGEAAAAAVQGESFNVAAYLKRIHRTHKIKSYDGDW